MDKLLELVEDRSFLFTLGIYFLAIVGFQLAGFLLRKAFRLAEQRRRLRAGLTEETLAGPARWFRLQRAESFMDALLLLVPALLVPPLLIWQPAGVKKASRHEIVLAFTLLFLWTLLAGTDLLKAFLGGVFFRVQLALNRAFHRGDRVVLRGISGRVENVGIFYVRLLTADDERVSIPTASLWTEILTSVNAGRRSSLSTLRLYLSPGVTPAQRRTAEHIFRNAVQTSPYFETSRRFELTLEQAPGALRLTAQAYVTDTYQEDAFRTDVLGRALDGLHEAGIPLSAGDE